MIKHKILAALLVLLIPVLAFAQGNEQDNRALDTRVKDLLTQLPATNQTCYYSLMKDMAGLGEEGLIKIAGMLVPMEKGDDAAVRYAVGGFSKFVTTTGEEERKKLCQRVWIKGLELAGESEVKAFLIAQIQLVGDELAIPVLERYITDDQLCDPVCRALVTINGPEAGKALLNALDKTQGESKLSVIKALGSVSYAPALDKLTALSVTQDMNEKKISLYAISKIGSPLSAELLYDAAFRSNFTYEPTEATSSYLHWLKALTLNGNNALAEKLCSGLIKTCLADNQVQTRSAALSILVQSKGEEAASEVYSSVKSKNREYIITALDLSKGFSGEKYTKQWIKIAGKQSGQIKADIVMVLGDRGDKTALSFLKETLRDTDERVRIAAIKASAMLGREEVMPELLEAMKRCNENETGIIKTQLLTYMGKNLGSAINQSISSMPSAAKIALIEIISARKIELSLGQVYRETESQDSGVRLAAVRALKDIVTEKDLDKLFNLLSSLENHDEIRAVQTAIISALRGMAQKEQTKCVIPKLKAETGNRRICYYEILAGIDSEEALVCLKNEFNKEDGIGKKAAFDAITHCKNRKVIDELISIGLVPANSAYREQALQASLTMIQKSDFPADQQLLLLRKAMGMATTDKERKAVLTEIGNCPTYLALKYAAGYLDNPVLQQESATAIRKIALSNAELYGEDVKHYLIRLLEIINGPESEYEKEAIRKHMLAMPLGAGFVSLFNGKDLSGWKGLVENPIVRSTMKTAELVKAQVKADEIMRKEWKVKDGILMFTGNDYYNLCTEKQYGDFEMIVDWKITENGDAGIYLRGSPQVQIWDTSRHDVGAQVGSGGLYNNVIHERNPLKVADNAVGEWNTFRIIMIGEQVTVYLNGERVVDHVILENFWDRSIPIFPVEQIELQAHGTLVSYRDIYIREIPRPKPFQVPEKEK